MPERNMPNAGDFSNARLSASTGVIADLRSKIKAAAYTGVQGCIHRQLMGNVHFKRKGNVFVGER